MEIVRGDRQKYIDFRLSADNQDRQQSLRVEIRKTEQVIRHLLHTLSALPLATICYEQGLLFAWAAARMRADSELAKLVEQPWLERLIVVPHSTRLELTVRLEQDPGRMVLCVGPSDDDTVPTVFVLEPKLTAEQDSPVFHMAVHGLASEGRLCEAAAACAQRVDSSLASTPREHGPVVLSQEVHHTYLLQRSAWLAISDPPQRPGDLDVRATARRLDQLYRDLFVLDRHAHELAAQSRNPDLLRQYADEWDRLCHLDGVMSLTLDNEQAELCTTRSGSTALRLAHSRCGSTSANTTLVWQT